GVEKVTPQGTGQTVRRAGAPSAPESAAALAAYADVIPPRAAWRSPVSGAVVAEANPPLRLFAEDEGSGVQAAETRLRVDGQPSAAQCAEQAGEIACQL
ncbi:hypothetical protein, partial [Endothiovibrio diazotrophicus]